MNRSRDWLDQAVRDLGLVTIDIEHDYWEWRVSRPNNLPKRRSTPY